MFLDVSKALDSMDRGVLIYKMYAYGLRGCVHKRLTSYCRLECKMLKQMGTSRYCV